MTVISPEDGARAGVPSLSLAPLQKSSDVATHAPLVELLDAHLARMGARNAYAPHVAPASGRIVMPHAVRKHYLQLPRATLWRNAELPADGTFLVPGEAFVMSAAGCPILIARARSYLLVAHAGRDSLLDPARYQGGTTRTDGSVVQAVVHAFEFRHIKPREISLRAFFAIPGKLFTHQYEHTEFGARNRALYQYVRQRWPSALVSTDKSHEFGLCLETLIREQATEAGIGSVRTGDALNCHPQMAHTRDGKDPSRRNLIIVARLAL